MRNTLSMIYDNMIHGLTCIYIYPKIPILYRLDRYIYIYVYIYMLFFKVLYSYRFLGCSCLTQHVHVLKVFSLFSVLAGNF